jgi:hypothetical protein
LTFIRVQRQASSWLGNFGGYGVIHPSGLVPVARGPVGMAGHKPSITRSLASPLPGTAIIFRDASYRHGNGIFLRFYSRREEKAKKREERMSISLPLIRRIDGSKTQPRTSNRKYCY